MEKKTNEQEHSNHNAGSADFNQGAKQERDFDQGTPVPDQDKQNEPPPVASKKKENPLDGNIGKNNAGGTEHQKEGNPI